jgi:hypothetical protein
MTKKGRKVEVMNDWHVVAGTLAWAHQRRDWNSCSRDTSGQRGECGYCRLVEADRSLARLIEWAVASMRPAESHTLSPVNRMVLTWFDQRLDDLAKMRGYQPSPLGLLQLLAELGCGFELESRQEPSEPEVLTRQLGSNQDIVQSERGPARPEYALWPP